MPTAPAITAQEIIALLGLQPHPKEGGYFRETYRAAEAVPAAALDPRYGGGRAHSTAIYYLLTPGTYSALHRVASDEVYHFYLGDPIEMLQLAPGAPGAHHGFALLGATVAPGFDYADYEHGARAALIAAWPDFRAQIAALTG
jgi:predicted cupin superfamily sugar epimerase